MARKLRDKLCAWVASSKKNSRVSSHIQRKQVRMWWPQHIHNSEFHVCNKTYVYTRKYIHIYIQNFLTNKNQVSNIICIGQKNIGVPYPDPTDQTRLTLQESFHRCCILCIIVHTDSLLTECSLEALECLKALAS